MRWTVRIAIIASTLSLLLLLLLKSHLEDLWDQYNVTAYLRTSLQQTFHPDNPRYSSTSPPSSQHGDKIIIMAKLKTENTDWVAEHLPEFVPPVPVCACILVLASIFFPPENK